MKPRVHALAGALAALLALAPAAPAATRKPPVTPAITQPLGGVAPAAPASANALCNIGVSGPRAWLLDYLQPPADAYYLRVQPSDCNACALTPGEWVSKVHVTLEFRAACSLPVEVAVVGALPGPGCRTPDDVRVLSGPWPGSLVAAAPGTYDFTLALSHPAAVRDSSYLRITFLAEGAGCDGDGTRPRLVTSSSCTNCSIFNYYPADSADLCELLVPGAPLIWAEVDSCVSASLASVGDGSAGPRALRVTPNPVRDAATLAFSLAATADAHVEIVDVAGRRVRALMHARLGAGPHALLWDGRDDAGARVRAGAYFAVVRGGGRTVSRSLVLLH